MAFIFDEVLINNGQLVIADPNINPPDASVSYTHLRAHET